MRRYTPCSLLVVITLGACDLTGTDQEQFEATLTGASEVPANASTATGTAEFTVNDNGTISYQIEVNTLRNVFAGHIHGPAATTANAPVLVTLFPGPGQAVPIALANGVLVQGSFGAAQIANAAVSLDSLLTIMRNGNSYVNLHTNDGVAPTNTGPGDLASGEIRGQIRRD